jgi:hypothetical protein
MNALETIEKIIANYNTAVNIDITTKEYNEKYNL